jgi:hypothetical protein
VSARNISGGERDLRPRLSRTGFTTLPVTFVTAPCSSAHYNVGTCASKHHSARCGLLNLTGRDALRKVRCGLSWCLFRSAWQLADPFRLWERSKESESAISDGMHELTAMPRGGDQCTRSRRGDARYLAKAGAKVNAITSMRCASAVADDHIDWLAIRYNVSDAAAAEAVFQRARDVHGFARSRQLRRPGARAAHSRR